MAGDPWFGRCLAIVAFATLGACEAQAQSSIWGYGFAGAGAAEIVSVVATSYERDNVTPTSFQIYRNVDGTVAWGGGVEWQSAGGVGIGAEVGALHHVDEPYYPGGLLAVNAVYHFQANRPFAPFVTGAVWTRSTGSTLAAESTTG